VDLQIVCKNVKAEHLQPILTDAFPELGLTLQSRPGHILIQVKPASPTDRILMECRKHAYAYIRLNEWEHGGGSSRTGEAVCISGLNGEPLKPITVKEFGETANKRHGLFSSRNGLVIARCQRTDLRYHVSVVEHRVARFVLEAPVVVLREDFEGKSMDDYLDGVDLSLDKFLPLLRAVIRKVDCPFCTHVHYRKVDDE
jgi:hypothetical protein